MWWGRELEREGFNVVQKRKVVLQNHAKQISECYKLVFRVHTEIGIRRERVKKRKKNIKKSETSHYLHYYHNVEWKTTALCMFPPPLLLLFSISHYFFLFLLRFEMPNRIKATMNEKRKNFEHDKKNFYKLWTILNDL